MGHRPPCAGSRAQAAERCRCRQGDFVSRERLAPSDRDGEDRAEGRREEELRDFFGPSAGQLHTEVITPSHHLTRSRLPMQSTAQQ